MTHKLIKTTDYILVVDDSEIQKGDCYLSPSGIWFYNHLNPNHNKESKKVCAHLPLNGSPILEGVDLLPPYSRHQEDGVEELAQEWYDKGELTSAYSFKAGYNKAREKYKYTEDDVWKAIVISKSPNEYGDYLTINDIIQSLHQYPTEFEKDDYQMSTLSNGQQVWVGKYK